MEAVFFEREAIIQFLKNNSYDYQKYNELLAAVILSSWYAAGAGAEDAPIGFAVKRKYYEKMTDELLGLEQIQNIIDRQIEDDTPIDIIISHLPLDKIQTVKMSPQYAWTYQIKRFIERPEDDATEKLINFLNEKIPKKYAKTNARLLILFEVATSIDLVRVADAFKPDSYPFSHIHFMGFDFKGKPILTFGDIWPERNKYQGDINHFFEYPNN